MNEAINHQVDTLSLTIVNFDQNVYSYWHYSGDTYWWAVPVNARFYFGAFKQGDFNTKYALQPSLDLNNNEYNFKLGKFVSKFKKYPKDYRLTMYKNLGNSTREGMFLYGADRPYCR